MARLSDPGARTYAFAVLLCLTAIGLLVAPSQSATRSEMCGLGDRAGRDCVCCRASERRLHKSHDLEFSISGIPLLFAAVLYGPLAAMAVYAASMAGDFSNESPQPRLKWAVYTSARAITGAVTGLVAVKASLLTSSLLGSVIVATVCAGLASEALDIGFNALTCKLRGRMPVRDLVREIGATAVASLPLTVSVVALLSFAAESLSIWILPVFFACPRGTTSLRSLPRAGAASGRVGICEQPTGEGKPLVCECVSHNARRARPVHGGAFCRGRDLRSRHCRSDGSFRTRPAIGTRCRACSRHR